MGKNLLRAPQRLSQYHSAEFEERHMKPAIKIDGLVKTLLLLITIFLGVIAFRPAIVPPAVKAQSSEGYPFYIEPGVTMLRAPRWQPVGLRQSRCRST